MLKGRVKQLCEAGLKAEYLSSTDLFKEEPDLLVDRDSAAAFLPVDCQLDAHRTVEYIEKVLYSFFFFFFAYLLLAMQLINNYQCLHFAYLLLAFAT